jgi:hypothetical protein
MKEKASIRGLRITAGMRLGDEPAAAPRHEQTGRDDAVDTPSEAARNTTEHAAPAEAAARDEAITPRAEDSAFVAQLVDRALALDAQLERLRQEQERIALAIGRLAPLREQYRGIVTAERSIADDGIEFEQSGPSSSEWPWQR